jgi:hypothetical protein
VRPLSKSCFHVVLCCVVVWCVVCGVLCRVIPHKSQGIPVPDVAPWFGRSIIRSCSNMDYGTAQRLIDDTITTEMMDSGAIRTCTGRGDGWMLVVVGARCLSVRASERWDCICWPCSVGAPWLMLPVRL